MKTQENEAPWKQSPRWQKAQKTCDTVDCSKFETCNGCIVYDIFKEEEKKYSP